jgi:hypothetical protein
MRGLLLAFVIAASGCATVSPLGRARVLEPGKAESGAAPLIGWARSGGSGGVPLLGFDLAYRQGITEKLELGGRFWGLPGPGFGIMGVAGELKWQLQRAPTASAGFDLSLANAVGYHRVTLGGTPSHVALATTTLLVGQNVSDRVQLVGGPRVMYQLWMSEGSTPVNVLFLGLSAGVAWRLSERFTLLPEISFIRTRSTIGQGDASERKTGSEITQIAIGFLYGG